MASLGTKLLNIRRHYRLSQTEISNILDVSQNAYNRWESDKCKPSANNLFKLSQYYKIDITKLLDDNERINMSSNGIKNENNIVAKNCSNIEIQPSNPLMEQMFQIQKRISSLLESQFCLMEELLKKNE